MPDGANPSQLLGYLQPITQQEMAKEHIPETGFPAADLVGQAGLEAQYNRALTGKPGTQTVSLNAALWPAWVATSPPPNAVDDAMPRLDAGGKASQLRLPLTRDTTPPRGGARPPILSPPSGVVARHTARGT